MHEQIVLCDNHGSPLGFAEKLASHTASTKLHLAFSCYVFDDQGRFLVTQRAHSKKVWPGVWTNSVCGHPAPGEDMIAAMQRRLKDELGMTAEDFQVLIPKYVYKTPPFKGIVEHEFCPIYIARASSEVIPNAGEVEDNKWIAWNDYVKDLEADHGDTYSWWSKDQLKLIKNHPLIIAYSNN
jgi:isopentenyl-diphosphate delta-isomerase